MPELSRFMGMIIKMIFLDNDRHHKPHVHVFYGDFKASVPSTENSLPENCRTSS